MQCTSLTLLLPVIHCSYLPRKDPTVGSKVKQLQGLVSMLMTSWCTVS
jgi:hypothetical protein